MNFRTELLLKASSANITLEDPIVTLGSCFSESIGQRFLDSKFQSLVNPFGTTYHPFSIHSLVQYGIDKKNPTEQNSIETNETFFNYDFHSCFHGSSAIDLQKEIKKTITSTNSFLRKCNVILLTYGTAFIYERKDTGEAVANCHKQPSYLFTKRLTSVEEITKSFAETIKLLLTFNPTVRIIVTVSPVRHLKDSIELNNISKSILRIACHQIVKTHSIVDYFPAFEIMMDDLRDYRFYKADLIHPTEVAEEYIWNKFCTRYFSNSTMNILSKWNEIRKAIDHRPFQLSSVSHQKFLRETLIKLSELKPFMNVNNEIATIESMIV